MIFGYIRAENEAEKKDCVIKLQEYGIDEIICEKYSKYVEGNEFQSERMKFRLKDVIVLPSIYHLPLSALQIIEFYEEALKEGFEIKSLREDIDINTIKYLGLHHQLHRKKKGAERTSTARSKKQNKKEYKINPKKEVDYISAGHLYETKVKKGKMTVRELLKEVGIGSAETLYKHLDKQGIKRMQK